MALADLVPSGLFESMLGIAKRGMVCKVLPSLSSLSLSLSLLPFYTIPLAPASVLSHHIFLSL